MSERKLSDVETSVTIDESAALAALDGQRELLQDLAVMFCEDSPQVLEELRLSVERENCVDARRAVHTLKGLASTFYAKPTVELAQQHEDAAAAGNLTDLAGGGVDMLARSIHALILELKKRGLTD
ncbi:MAG: Hpt domain-containing protein [Planctomycetales bacterium]|nr:Hpt domain-containing protein [Planctomycetales bacterium]